MANNQPTVQNQNQVKTIDPVDKALSEAMIQVRRDRTKKIGLLLDKATDVLSAVLDTDDTLHENMRMRAAELTIGLYTAQESSERADKQLEIQSRRLEVEEKKIGVNTLLLQQNNIYPAAPPKTLVQQSDGSVVDVDLLARKKAQQMLLDSQLQQVDYGAEIPPKVVEIEKEIDITKAPNTILDEDGNIDVSAMLRAQRRNE